MVDAPSARLRRDGLARSACDVRAAPRGRGLDPYGAVSAASYPRCRRQPPGAPAFVRTPCACVGKPCGEPGRRARWHLARYREGGLRRGVPVFGLPEGVVACLFDLDGVLTDTARRAHHAPGRQMFDDYLRERAARTGQPFVAFDPDADYQQYVDGKPREDGVRSFLASRGIDLPEGEPGRRRPTPRRSPGWATARTTLFQQLLHDDGVEVFEGSRRYLEAVARRGPARVAVVSSSANTARGARGHRAGPLVAAAGRRRDASREEHLARQAGARLVPARRRAARRRRRAGPPSSRTRCPAWPPAGPAPSASSSASTGSGRPTRCAATAPTSSSTDLGELL